MIGRRGFITGLVSLVAAPAIVRAGSLMPVKVMDFDPAGLVEAMLDQAYKTIYPPYGISPAMQALQYLEEYDLIISRIIHSHEYLVAR